jgi:serine/threonine protein kinase/tetratricopeptide (TPR) repeat protein
MAEVFLAKKRGAEGTFKLLVVKRVLPQYGSSRRFRAMFAEEAQLATRLNHPNIVQVYEFQDYGDEGQLLSMEYVEGPDLRKLVRAAQARGARVPPFVAAYMVAEAAKGLHYAHERKDEGGAPLDIVHRDVSPQNILLSHDGSVKVADFGIATANLFREEPGVLKGKTGYMSPEQARAERVDRRTDVYSLGVVLYELLAGRAPHGAAEGQELLEAVRIGRVEPPSTYAREVPSELEAIAMRALAPTPEERFQTARDMASAITRALFQRQQVVDAHVLEVVINQLVRREDLVEADALPDASAESGRSSSRGEQSGRSDASAAEAPATQDGPTGAELITRAPTPRESREVRHVAVVRLRLHGLEDLSEARGAAEAQRVSERLRGILDEMAWKRGARWSWEARSDLAVATDAQAVVGLTQSSARAALDAARLAVDVHEALRAACDDEDAEQLEVSVGLVRGIAWGRRDRGGHLIDHALQEPAGYLTKLLCSVAPPGRTWVAGGLYRLVRREFVWSDGPPPLEVEDAAERKLPRLLRLFELVRPMTREERAQFAAQAKSDLVGRDVELAELQAAFHQASTPPAGGGLGLWTCRLVSGEIGIGKTALTNAFLAELPPETRVVQVECTPARADLPYATVAELIRELSETREKQLLDEVEQTLAGMLGEQEGGKAAGELASRLAPLVIGRVPAAIDEADVNHNRRLVLNGVRRLLSRMAGGGPLVIVVDGLQWCDRQSLEVLADLARRGDTLPLLLVYLTRPDERVAPFLEGIVRLELRELSSENQVRLLEARLGATHGVAEVCADLLPRAGGNPFFLIEMVDALLERGTLELRERTPEDPGLELVRVERPGDAQASLPSTLEQLLGDRLNELPEAERQVIDWLAIAGGPVHEDVVHDLLPDDGDDAVVRLCARGLCDVRNDAIDVRHPLTRDVAYRALEPDVRARMHLALGRQLLRTNAASGLGAGLVARHLARGGATSEAADLYLEAAHTAQNSYQLQAATRYFRRAVRLLGENDARALRAHDALEALCRIQGWWRERRKHLAELRRLAKASRSPHWVARALLRTARYELDQGLVSRALKSAQRAERVAHEARSPVLEVQAQSMLAEVLRDLGDMQGALAACDRALATGKHPEVPSRLRAEVLRARGTLLRRVGRVHEAVDAHAEAIAVFKQVGARRMEARAKNSLAFAMFALGRYEDSIALALEALRIDLAIGGRLQIAKTLSTIGQCYARLGDLARGLAYLRRAREAHERYGDQDSRADTLLSMAEVLIELGDLSGADTLIGDAGALNAVSGNAYDAIHERILRALLARAAGEATSGVLQAFDARQAAEAQAYVAYHFHAMAIEAASRVDVGELHTAILLATTVIGALETVPGSEYGLESRALAVETLVRAGSPLAEAMRRRASRHAEALLASIRDPYYRSVFLARPPVRTLLRGRLELEGGASTPQSPRASLPADPRSLVPRSWPTSSDPAGARELEDGPSSDPTPVSPGAPASPIADAPLADADAADSLP